MRYQQQGDTLYFHEKIPSSAKHDDKFDGIVQHGEATGHAHRLHGDGFRLYSDAKSGERYLRILKPTALRHEEHHEQMFAPGDYRIGIVREYDHFEEETRNVVD